MKKLLGILLFAIATIGFVACGGDAKTEEKKECCHNKDKKECTPADSAKCAEEGKTCEPGCEKEDKTQTPETAPATEEHSHDGHEGHTH